VFEVGEEATDRVSRRRSIESRSKPDIRILKLSLTWTNAVVVFVVAVKKAMDQFWWFMVSCSPRFRQGEHVEIFKKLNREVLKQR
jgi:hypothetical protein